MTKRMHVRKGDEWPGGISDGLTLPCKLCGRVPEFDYMVSEDMWRELISEEDRRDVICLPCLDRVAVAKGIDFADALERVQFTGRGQTIILTPIQIVDYDIAETR